MAPENELVEKLAEQARGRCHSCLYSRAYELPSGTRYWCRAFNVEMSEEEHREVRGCPRWRVFTPPGRAVSQIAQNPLLKELVDSEDLLFWQLKYHLENHQLDLKTLITVAHPGTDPVEDLGWIRTLEGRFEDRDPQQLSEVLSQLRALGYSSLSLIVTRALGYQNGVVDDA